MKPLFAAACAVSLALAGPSAHALTAKLDYAASGVSFSAVLDLTAAASDASSTQYATVGLTGTRTEGGTSSAVGLD